MEVDMAEALPARKMEKTALELLEESRTSMEEIVAKMLFVKKEGRPKAELRELVTQMSLHFVNLHQINRSILLEEDRVKAETECAKAPVDFTTLQLHNLLYEKNHYLKAIKACKDFKSKHPDIELVPEEEFFSSAPEEIKGIVISNNSSHDLMLKRLNFELFQRKELCKLHEKLEQHKKSLMMTIANRKKFLSNLPSQLKSLKKASLPVQHQLGVLHTKKLKQHYLAELLPPPLYVIYSQLLAQKEAFGENIDMEIIGSIKDAQALTHQQANKDAGISTNTETNRLEDDAPDEDNDGQRRRKRPKKVAGRESPEQAGIYQSHPLKIILHIYNEEVSNSQPLKLISLRFEYLLKLNAVCVGNEWSHEGPETNILCNLFPNDTGIELPHQSAKFIAGDAVTFDDKRTPRPYKWAQHLAGIDFLPEVSPLLTSPETPTGEMVKNASVVSNLSLYRQQNRVHTVVQRIRSQKKAQMAYREQLDFLMKLQWPPLTYGNVPWALHNHLCNLQSWSSGSSPHQVSSLSAVAMEQVLEPSDLDMEGRSVTTREDMESAREVVEKPAVVQVPTVISDSILPVAKTVVSEGTDLEHSRCLAFHSEGIVLLLNKTKSLSFWKNDEDSVLILDDESDLDEAAQIEPESVLSIGCYKIVSWDNYGVKEFCLVLNKKMDKTERAINLEAKVKSSMEYPLRPPLFTLGLYSAPPGENSYEMNDSEWFNELHAMGGRGQSSHS